MGNCCHRERDAFDEDASAERISYEKGMSRSTAPEELAAAAATHPPKEQKEKENVKAVKVRKIIFNNFKILKF